MKETVLALVTLAAGAAIGLVVTRQEFAHDVVPVDLNSSASKTTSASAEKVGPKATVLSGERHDFGSMDRNQKGNHVFVVRNDGDAPLTLSAGKPTCQCTVFSVDKETVPPGETANVSIAWEFRTSDALFEQSGPLNTNDARHPTIHLTIRGRVIETVRAERGDVHFSDISANEPKSESVNIYSFRSADLAVVKHELQNADIGEYFDVSFAPLAAEEVAQEPEAKGGIKMTIGIKKGLLLGPFDVPILVTTNQNEGAPLTIRVIGNVASDILLRGPRVDGDRMLVAMGNMPRAAGGKHTVFLVVKGPFRDQTQLRITSVEPSAEFSATLGEPDRDDPRIVRYPLTIEVPAGATPVSHWSEGAYAQIHVAATHPDVKELTVKVRYVVKE